MSASGPVRHPSALQVRLARPVACLLMLIRAEPTPSPRPFLGMNHRSQCERDRRTPMGFARSAAESQPRGDSGGSALQLTIELAHAGEVLEDQLGRARERCVRADAAQRTEAKRPRRAPGSVPPTAPRHATARPLRARHLPAQLSAQVSDSPKSHDALDQ